jgi:hypothetical protein
VRAQAARELPGPDEGDEEKAAEAGEQGGPDAAGQQQRGDEQQQPARARESQERRRSVAGRFINAIVPPGNVRRHCVLHWMLAAAPTSP